jgi:hypothetical protein
MSGKTEKAVSAVIALKDQGTPEQASKLNRLYDLDIPGFCENLGWDLEPLRAFAALLENADLSEFDQGKNADTLKTGLRMIVEACLDRQQRRLDEMRQKSLESYEWLIGRAKRTYKTPFKDAKSALEKTQGALKDLAQVISERGDEYPQAQALRKKLTERQETIQAKRH